MVKNINTRGVNPWMSDVVVAGGKAYFSAEVDGVRSIWESDGSESGTSLATSVTGTHGHHLLPFAAAGDHVLLAPFGSSEVWGFGASNRGSRLLYAGTDRSIRIVGTLADRVILSVPEADTTYALYSTDGTVAGTEQLTDQRFRHRIATSGLINPGVLFFVVSTTRELRELWRTDGTRSGTYRVAPFLWAEGPLERVGDRLVFRGQEVGTGRWSPDLWALDVHTLIPSRLTNTGSMGEVLGLDDYVVAVWRDGNRRTLYRTDGTASGTTAYSSLAAGLTVLGRAGKRLLFTTYTSTEGTELWRTNGTAAGTGMLADIYPGPTNSDIDLLASACGKLYFAATSPSTGAELWVSDGQPEGTRVIDIFGGPGSSTPFSAAASGCDLFVMAETADAGGTLVHVDAAAGVTRTVSRQFSSPKDGNAVPRGLRAYGSSVIFQATHEEHGEEVWISDGTEAGTRLFYEAVPGASRGTVGTFVGPRGHLFIFAIQNPGTLDLLRFDPQPEATLSGLDKTLRAVSLGDLMLITARGRLWAGTGQPGSMEEIYDSNSRRLKVYTGTRLAYFIDDREQWFATDGSATFTWPLPVSPSSLFNGAVVINDTLYTAETRDGMSGLWRITADGSAELVWHNPHGSTPSSLTAFGSRVLMASGNGPRGSEPLVYEPSSRDVWPLFADGIGNRGDLSGFMVVQDRAFISMGVHSVWQTDGTHPARHVLTADGAVYLLGDVDGELLLNYNDGIHGEELWITNGTESRLLADLNPGPASSSPSEPTRVGDRLFISAEAYPHGRELWVLTYDSTPEPSDRARPVPIVVPPPFPNPATGLTRIAVPAHQGPIDITLYDVLGREVRTIANLSNVTNSTSQAVDLAGLSAGVYLLTVDIAGYRESHPLIVRR
ncbi:MAG: T9SS type A sorting domain-containing protein [Rhodothermales bacterium]|nr:T9SS type A sorting domain-containing protein [Rhodothermales bacterium]